MSIIRVIDFETSELELEDGAVVIEAGYTDLHVETGDIGHWQSRLFYAPSIPPHVRAVHHITRDMVKEEPPFDPDWLRSDEVTCYAAHNAAYELKFFEPEKPMICTFKAAKRLFPELKAHNNHALRYWLEDEGMISLIDEAMTQPAHRAGPDTYVTAHIMKALLSKATGKEMAAWTKEPVYMPVCPIGKEHKGKSWDKVDGGFLQWMLRQDTMEEDLK